MQNLIIAFLLVSFYCYADSITSSATCQSFDGGYASGPTCAIGPYYINANGLVNLQVDVEATYSVYSAVNMFANSDVYEVLGAGVTPNYGTASITTTAMFDFYSAGPLRQGYAVITAESTTYDIQACGAVSIMGPAVPGAIQFCTFDDNGVLRPPVSIIPITLGADFTLVLTASSGSHSDPYDGDSFGQSVDAEVQLFEDPTGHLGAPVEIFAQTPEPSTWIVLLPLLFVLKVFEGGWLGRRRRAVCAALAAADERVETLAAAIAKHHPDG